MRLKTLLLGAAVASMFMGCAKTSEGVTYTYVPKIQTKEDTKSFSINGMPLCPKMKEVKISSTTTVSSIKSIDLRKDEKNTKIEVDIDNDIVKNKEELTFKGCKDKDGSYSFKIKKTELELVEEEKI